MKYNVRQRINPFVASTYENILKNKGINFKMTEKMFNLMYDRYKQIGGTCIFKWK